MRIVFYFFEKSKCFISLKKVNIYTKKPQRFAFRVLSQLAACILRQSINLLSMIKKLFIHLIHPLILCLIKILNLCNYFERFIL